MQRSLLTVIIAASAFCSLAGCQKQVEYQDHKLMNLDQALLSAGGFQELWMNKLPIKNGEKVSDIHIHDKYLFVITTDNYMFCINRDKGNVRFSRSLANPGLPLRNVNYYQEKVLYMVGNRLLVIDPEIGQITADRVLKDIGSSSVCGVVRNEDYYFVSGGDKKIHVIDAAEFFERYSVTAANDSLITSIVAFDSTVVFATEAGNIECFSSSERRKMWQYDVMDSIYAPISQEGEVIYVASQDTKLYKLSINTGQNMWSEDFKAGAPLTTRPVVGSLIYQYAGDKGLYGVNKETGKAIWDLPGGLGIMAEKNGKAYSFAEPGILVVVDNVTGRKEKTLNLANATVFASNLNEDATIYVSGDGGDLYSIKIID